MTAQELLVLLEDVDNKLFGVKKVVWKLQDMLKGDAPAAALSLYETFEQLKVEYDRVRPSMNQFRNDLDEFEQKRQGKDLRLVEHVVVRTLQDMVPLENRPVCRFCNKRLSPRPHVSFDVHRLQSRNKPRLGMKLRSRHTGHEIDFDEYRRRQLLDYYRHSTLDLATGKYQHQFLSMRMWDGELYKSAYYLPPGESGPVCNRGACSSAAWREHNRRAERSARAALRREQGEASRKRTEVRGFEV